jgi:hypothetical protein
VSVLFSYGDQVDFTLLDIVKLQTRSNHIDAAISTASRIVDETEWIAAMETIAVGQLEGGDHTGASHTAKLMTPAINRNGVLTRIALTQAHSGNVKGAIATVTHIDAPLRRNAVLLGIAIIRARHGDLPGALAAADTIEGEISRATASREIGTWETINTLTPLIDTSSALHGMANDCLNNRGGRLDASY